MIILISSVKDILLSCFGMQRWFSTNLTINNPTWYISVLLLCYIWFYVITYIANKTKISPYIMYLAMILLGVFIMTRGVSYPFFHHDTSRGYIAFFLGICFGKLLETINVQKMRYQIISAIYCILFIGGDTR